MVIRKTMTNIEIYNTASSLADLYNSMVSKNIALPIKANFYFQKNMNLLIEMAKELETERTNILNKFGTPDKDNPDQLIIDPNKVDEANQELNDLFSLEQEITVNLIELDWFGSIDMTPQQFTAVAFMIKDEV